MRVAYVAATRARDLLVVCATGDLPCPGWVEPLNAALYPPEDRRREASRDQWAVGFGNDTSSTAPTRFRSPACSRASTASGATSRTP